MNSFNINELKYQEIHDISAIHMKELPGDFLPSLGKNFLDTYFYPSVLQSEQADVLVAKEGDHVVGFVVITLNSGKFLTSMILRRAWGFFITGLRYSLSSINNFMKTLEILSASFRPDQYSDMGEIYVIAVRKDKQGVGVGKALVSGAIHYLKNKGSRGIRIKTLKKNAEWINFFFNHGWLLIDEFNLIHNDYVMLAMEFTD